MARLLKTLPILAALMCLAGASIQAQEPVQLAAETTVVSGEPRHRRAYLQTLIESAKRQNLAKNPEWLRLVHYRRTPLGFKSEIDGPEFFLSQRGRRNPQSELEATLKAFFEPAPSDPEQFSAACRFRARFEWLRSKLSFDPAVLPDPSCPVFEKWYRELNPGSLSLVYASAYLNNPASMYGHTFLRVNRAGDAPVPHLDYTVNFAAETADRGGLAFAVKGLFGLYPGKFTTMPYYFKVQQYNNIEGRDLREYSLALSTSQVRRVLLHLWEMGPTYFDYYFLNQNCSYQLLPLLEVAVPELNLSARPRFRFWTLPTESVRALKKVPGLVGHAETRPSLMREIFARRARLLPQELALAEYLAEGGEETALESLSSYAPERRALILDTAYDYFRYRHDFKRYQTVETDQAERAILVRRGEVGLKSSELSPPVIEEVHPPESGHGTSRIGLAYGLRKGSSFEELSLRPAMHDIAEDPKGYVPNSQLEMFHLRARYNNDRKRLHVERLTLIDIMSLSPFDRWVKPLSWKFFAGLDTAKDLGLEPEDGLHFRVGGGAGFAAQTKIWRRETFYVFGEADGGVSGAFRDSYRAGIGGEVGATWEIFSFWRGLAEVGFRRYHLGNLNSVTRGRLIQSLTLGKRMELRATLTREQPSEEALFTFHLYF